VSARSTKDERQEDGIVAHYCMEIRPAGATNQEMTSVAKFLCSRTSRDVWRTDLSFALQCHRGLPMTDWEQILRLSSTGTPSASPIASTRKRDDGRSRYEKKFPCDSCNQSGAREGRQLPFR
jgi:hypothetical protein